MKFKAFLAGLMAFSSLAWASNIRVIGNGGGDLEMRALSEFHYMPWIISLCEMEVNYCELSEGERQLLGHSQAPHRLEFHDEGELFRFMRSDGVLSINISFLTVDNLSVLIFEGFLRYALEFGSFELAIADRLSDKLFGRGEWKLSSLDIWNQGQLRSFEFLESAALLIRLKDNTSVDLTPAITKALGCSSTPQIRQFSKLSREQGGFSAEILWSCEGESFQGRLIGFISEGEWSFRIFSQRPAMTLFTAPECSQLLEAHHRVL